MSDEQALVHPTGHLEPFYIAAVIGGALLFIGGTMLFKRITSGQNFWPLSHCAGLLLFALLGLWANIAHPQPLTLHLLSTVVFLFVAAWEWGSFHGGWAERLDRLRAPKG